MIEGRGDIAKAILDREGFYFYCNGVSNRKPLDTPSEAKEIMEVINAPENLMLVYISTLSIYYSYSDYTEHKKKMESIIKKNFENYCILRIGNINWGTNPNTIINNLKYKINHKQKFECRDEYRYIINKDELNHWIGMIPAQGKHEMNITGMRYKIKDIVYHIKNGNL